MIRFTIIIAAVSGLACLDGHSIAGCHAVAIKKQAVVAYTPVYQPYYYSVGANLQAQASEERIANLVIQKLQAQQQTAPERLPLTAEVDRWANTKQVCAGCHATNADALAAFDMADFSVLTCEQKLSAVRHLAQGTMPPPDKKQITPEQRGQIIGEFAGANNVDQP